MIPLSPRSASCRASVVAAWTLAAEEIPTSSPSSRASGTEVDLQLSGLRRTPHPEGLPRKTLAPGRRESAIGPAQAGMSSSTVRLTAGQLLGGRYRIERELGEGGMGVVYLAADEQVPGERFAIKVLKEDLKGNVLRVKTFNDENMKALTLS